MPDPLTPPPGAPRLSFAGRLAQPVIHVGEGMDPRLQRLVLLRQKGISKLAASSTAPDEAAVVAKVTDVSKWEGLSEVRMGAVLGDPAPDGTSIVTGRIPVSRIEAVRAMDFVRSLKAAQRITPSLNRTIEETGARADLLPAGHAGAGGTGVVVGVVDFGCDFAHRNLKSADGRTRLLALWDQNASPTPSSPFGFGRVYTPGEINAALKRPDPYAALGYGPEPDRPGEPPGRHGTHVCDIAVGNGLGSGAPGVAPNADLIFVELASTDTPWQGTEVVGRSFGDSVQLLEAVRFIFDTAGERPCVVNLSLGTNGGPHDGTMLVEDGLDRLVKAAPNRAIVIAASNSFADGIHAEGTVPAGQEVELKWQVPADDFTHNEMEIWYPGPARLSLALVAPDGTSLGTVAPGAQASVEQAGKVTLFAANRLADPNNGHNMIGIFLEQGVSGGEWRVRLLAEPEHEAAYHAWIERDDQSPSQFAPPLNNSHTLGSVSCGHESIAVGSYDAHKGTVPLSFFSSAGPTRDGRQKPELSAPGHDVLAAHSRTLTKVVRKSGTSMASPAVTGIVALLLAEARSRGRSLNIGQIREILMASARKNPPPAGGAWDPRYGFGRISAKDVVAAVMRLGAASGSGGSRRGRPGRPVTTAVRRAAPRRRAKGRG